MTRNLTSGAPLTRRRFIAVAAAAAGVAPIHNLARAGAPETVTWRGVALGANASLTLVHPDAAAAREAIVACLAEVARLENIFSLHKPDSALARLNAMGELTDVPADLRVLLSQALLISERTGGAFDPTVQPLWSLYAGHFRQIDAAREGPGEAEIENVLRRVGWKHVDISSEGVRFAKPGMALTLNGIAQGYITDKAGELLKSRGFANVLVNMGEQLALGPKGDERPWSVGIAAPSVPDAIATEIPLSSGAVATSGGYGTQFDAAGRFPHILDPRTGRSATSWASITVVSDRATVADGLSTALAVLPETQAGTILGRNRAYAVTKHGGTGHWIGGA